MLELIFIERKYTLKPISCIEKFALNLHYSQLIFIADKNKSKGDKVIFNKQVSTKKFENQ